MRAFAPCAVMLGLFVSDGTTGNRAPPAAPADATPKVQEPAPKSPVPEDATVYHTLAGGEAQVLFTTDAPLEKLSGKSNQVVGYAVSGPKDHPERLRGGVWLLPVDSLATGIPLRDEHLAGPDWLDAREHPTIEFELLRVEDVEQVKAGEGFSTWDAALVGTMTVHGKSKEVRIAGTRLTLFAESEKTKAIAPGDLLFIKCSYSIHLSDYGVTNKDIPKKVSDTVAISEILRLSTKVAETQKTEPSK